MSENKLIVPRKVQGFWELMPEQQTLFASLLSRLEKVFKENCFVPLDTPVLEFSDALLAKSGGETDKQVFRFNKGDADLCMRYDLTVPLARFVAMHKNELNFPFKRYQIGKVYRGERPQKGRFREFYQCDADIIGDGELSLVADAECVNLFEKCFDELGLDVEIRLSNRKILSGFLQEIGMEEKSHEILTILDKVEKVPENVTIEELKNQGLDSEKSEKLINLTKKCGKIEEILPFLRNFCQNALFQEGVNELEILSNHLTALESKSVVCSLSIIRGHDYYTGTVFEGFLHGGKDAVGGGGRFDNLCGYFSNDKMPGVGMSVGITRLFDLLLSENYFGEQKASNIDVGIITFDETLSFGLKIMAKLRKNGIKAEIFSENKSFKSKMKEANRRNVRYVLIVGEDEVKTEKYALKDMESGEQTSCTIEEIISKLKA